MWWPKIDADADKRCKSCRPSQVVGPSAPPEPMARTEMPTGAWQDLCMDLHGPYPDGTNLLAVQDYYSRYPEVVFMKSTTTDKILDALDEMFARFGFPFPMKSDNGPQFIGGAYKEYMARNGIIHWASTPLWAQANGEVENFNKNLGKTMKIAEIEKIRPRRAVLKFRWHTEERHMAQPVPHQLR